MMVTLDDMRSKLLTLDQVEEKVAATEPLNQTHVSADDKILFQFDPQWAIGFEDKDGTSVVDAVIRLNGNDHILTKDAVLQAGAAFGLPGKYAARLPHNLLEAQLNYWFASGMGDKAFNMLSTGADQRVAAFTRPTINPFSNRLLIEEVVRGIHERYGDGVEILADYKFNHSLVRTDVRFVIPEAIRLIAGGGMGDVPAGEQDQWAGGIHLTNSLIGKSQTKLETYLFRWWCTNGATTQMADVGTFSRRGEHEEQDVYEWASNAVDEVLGGLETQFDQVQALTQLSVEGNAADIVGDIFDRYRVPVSQRQDVLNTLMDAESLNLYTVMNAITQTANEEDLSPDRVDKILRIGGAIPGATFNSLKAQVWAEGHLADPEAPNPYEIRTV
jgi:hypothetical protein